MLNMFIVTKEIDSENISKLCRTCLREDGEKMICLFMGPAGSSLAAKLRSLSCLEVWQGDGLPEKMCDRCVTRAESALLYREQCRAADRALRQAALKVSGLTSYTTVSGCKLYQQDEGFVPIHNSQTTLKCIECGAVFMNYQELCIHNKVHVPFTQDSSPTQHMHIVESQSSYLNLSQISDNAVSEGHIPLIVKPRTLSIDNENPNRAACALHCSLCNHTFTNRTQLISHNFTHSTDNVDTPHDDENVEIGEESNPIARNLSYDRCIGHSMETSIQNLSYPRSSSNNDDEIQNLNYSESVIVSAEHVNIPNPVQNLGLHSKKELSTSQDLSFSKLPDKSKHLQNGIKCDGNPINENLKIDQVLNTNTTAKLKKYKCDTCYKSFSQKSKLSSHQLSHTGQRPFKCTSCDKAYSSKSKLNAHRKLHSNTNVHRCIVCNKTFPYPSYLTEHAKIHNNNVNEERDSTQSNSFECNICNKRYRLAKNLKAHLKFHTGEGLVQCEICDKQFNKKYNLKVHLQMHKPTNLHKCEFCNKTFIQKGNLVEHLRIHTKVKPFKCKQCDKSFSQSSHLKSHEASHELERRHQCRLCGRRFKLASHLKRHLNVHAVLKTFKCDQCNQLFSQAFSLKRHSKRHNESHT
ncbi:zinc finger protein 845 [Orussus abietinus]|uniref:zinc finger protein 845 n=1 Tax=Orussus abietinus TaxID=222816 RepID=UPI00062664CB|nr:zinc finger protein 845 [Orussus abietinus]